MLVNTLIVIVGSVPCGSVCFLRGALSEADMLELLFVVWASHSEVFCIRHKFGQLLNFVSFILKLFESDILLQNLVQLFYLRLLLVPRSLKQWFGRLL